MVRNLLWGRTILIVDDEDFSRAIVARMVRKLDALQIREATDGAEALHLLRRNDTVSAVICDFNMPHLNGLEFLRAVRCGDAGVARNLPIAMLTGYSDVDVVNLAVNLDVSAFLIKPVTLGVLAERLSRIMSEDLELEPPEAYADIVVPSGGILPVDDSPDVLDVASKVEPSSPPYGAVCRRLEDVAEGDVLARDLVLRNGITVIEAGQVLKPKLLARLHELKTLDYSIEPIWVFPDGAQQLP